MAKVIWMEVTRDALSLPLAIADSAKELSEMRGVPTKRIQEMVWRWNRGLVKQPRFVSVEIEEEE